MLVGRAAECGQLERLLDAARSGVSGVVLIRGEPGAGKSTLLQDAAERAAGMRVLRCSGIESESELPFAALQQLVRPVLGQLDRLPEPQAQALRGALGLALSDGADRFMVSVAVLGLLAEAAEEQPLLCLVDDVQWLDEPSAAALVFAARRLQAEHVAFVLTSRPDGGRTIDGAGLPELRVEGLDAAAAEALLDLAVDGELAPMVRDRLVSETGGNPLALVDVAKSLRPGQLAGLEALPDRLPLGPDLERAFLGRLRSLPAETQRLALVAAADDTRSLAVVQRAATSLRLPLEALGPAEAGRLVRIAGDRIEFWHPLVRSAIYHGATFGERRSVHQALAEAQDADDEDRRAWHRAAAAVDADEDVAAELERSAERASRRSGYAAAAAALRRAAGLTPPGQTRARRLVAAADASYSGGDPDAARVLLDDAARMDDGSLRTEMAQLRGRIEIRTGVPLDGFALLVEAAQEVAGRDPALALDLLADAADATVAGADPKAAVALGELAAELAVTADAAGRIALGLLRGHAALVTGNAAAALPYLREAVEAAREVDDPERLMLAGLAATAMAEDDVTGRDLFLRGVELARTRGMLGALPTGLIRLAYPEIAMGRYRSARTHIEEGLRLAIETGQDPGRAVSILAYLSAIEGREEDCRRLAADALRRAVERQAGNFHTWGHWSLAMFDLGMGRAEEAFVRLAPLVAEPPSGILSVTALQMTPDAIEAAVRAGHVEAARPLLARFERWVGQSSAPWGLSVLARCRGLLATGDEAEQHLTEALRLGESARRPFENARTELVLGEALRRSRKRREAREHLRAAAEIFGRLGAAPWEERAANELRATGETARKRDPSTLGDLTPQELQIARRVSLGARNREIASQLFLSPRTVDYHLRKVFLKLGITSRGELAQMDLGGGEDLDAMPAPAR
jgi:DNA-binding CsgD family transcriptional regulator